MNIVLIVIAMIGYLKILILKIYQSIIMELELYQIHRLHLTMEFIGNIFQLRHKLWQWHG